ncbi:hypothetical protein [Acidovorax lacteus]|uniref:Chemotaxis protein n=1 Tax=Acidovorax lacteus TaxID=1924988 RepID=A0ABP8LGE7_9BURK
MAAGWIAALKLVPWADVIEATPQVVQAARRLMGSAATTNAAGAETPQQQAERRMAQLEQELAASAQLIERLAEQHAQVVRAVDALRRRQQRLVWTVAALGVAATLPWLWVVLRG